MPHASGGRQRGAAFEGADGANGAVKGRQNGAGAWLAEPIVLIPKEKSSGAGLACHRAAPLS
jgi:hypothetical protein